MKRKAMRAPLFSTIMTRKSMNPIPDWDREYPYVTAKEVHLSGIVTESGKEIRLKENPYSMPGLCNVYLGKCRDKFDWQTIRR